MHSDFSQTKTYKSRTQPAEEVEHLPDSTAEHYINPIIKHTLDSLPVIYGANVQRKRKYNMFMRNKLQLSNIITGSNVKPIRPSEKLYNRLNQLDNQRQRGNSCLEMNKMRQHQYKQRQDITKTVVRHSKHVSRSPEQLFSKEQTKSHCTATPKNKRLLNVELMHSLSKPKEHCNKQYCSCKSLFQQYRQEIKKKLKSKQSTHSNRIQNLSRIQLPRLSVDLNKKSPPKLDDQESKHKVNFKYKINTLQQESQQTNHCCIMCNKNQKSDSLELKGLLGLINKKQLQEKKKKLSYHSHTQNIGIQSNIEIMAESQIHDYGIQADLVTTKKKLQTIDQQINTDFQDENKDFKYLENNRSLKDSSVKQKKQPLEHLSHLKEMYKLKKRPTYEPKNEENYDQDQDYDCHHKESNKSANKLYSKSQLKRHKNKRPAEQQEQFDISMQSESVMSEKSLMNHLAKALNSDKNNKSTIFKILKKKQEQQSQSQAARNSSNGKRKSKHKSKQKNMNLIDEDTGLFAIPEEQQYVDYLKSYKPLSKDFKIKNLIKSENFKILKYNDTLYFGQTDGDNKKHGKALLISPKQIFEGCYQNGIKMSGCERNIDGVYFGQFLNGQRHGQGKWLWNNGQHYEGEWKLGTKNGHGIWKSPKGDTYEGQWLLNRQQGKGIHRHRNSVYEGQFVQSLKEGNGKQKFINGDQYVGQYSKGKPHGKGKYVWKNGNYYDGSFKNGLRQGFGKWYFSPRAFYEGQFKGDFRHGKGKQSFENGDQYEGQYSEGIKTKGIFFQCSTNKTTEITTDNSINKGLKKLEMKRQQKEENNIEKLLKDSKVYKKQKTQQEKQQSGEETIEKGKRQGECQSEDQKEIQIEIRSRDQKET